MKDLILFVHRGKLRRKLVKILVKGMTPTKAAKKLKTHRSSVSRAILALEKKNLIKCLNLSDSKFKFYKTTELGLKVDDLIKKRNRGILGKV